MNTHPDKFGAEATRAEATLTGDVGQTGAVVIPVVEETLEVGVRQFETGRVLLTKNVLEREETVDVPLMHTQVQVDRVEINRLVDGPQPVRTEGDTTVYPILEEVLVVEKRLMLREEVRVTRLLTERHDPQQVTLRREEVTVERLEP